MLSLIFFNPSLFLWFSGSKCQYKTPISASFFYQTRIREICWYLIMAKLVQFLLRCAEHKTRTSISRSWALTSKVRRIFWGKWHIAHNCGCSILPPFANISFEARYCSLLGFWRKCLFWRKEGKIRRSKVKGRERWVTAIDA